VTHAAPAILGEGCCRSGRVHRPISCSYRVVLAVSLVGVRGHLSPMRCRSSPKELVSSSVRIAPATGLSRPPSWAPRTHIAGEWSAQDRRFCAFIFNSLHCAFTARPESNSWTETRHKPQPARPSPSNSAQCLPLVLCCCREHSHLHFLYSNQHRKVTDADPHPVSAKAPIYHGISPLRPIPADDALHTRFSACFLR
jgi:hypothetical protein